MYPLFFFVSLWSTSCADLCTLVFQLCKSRAGNDLYAERGMNTFNEAPKLKAIQTTKIGYAVSDGWPQKGSLERLPDYGLNSLDWD